MTTIDTRDAAEAYIITAIEATGVASRDEYDITAIADRLYDLAGGTWDIQHTPHDTFWAIVEEGEL